MTIVASRDLEFGADQTVVLEFAQPEQEDENAWRCEYRILWPDRTRKRFGAGVDGVQALLAAMSNAHAELLSTPESKAGLLTWCGRRDLDLPLAGGFKAEDFV